jgi:hypothetical protein
MPSPSPAASDAPIDVAAWLGPEMDEIPYQHAQQIPDAVAYGRPLHHDTYAGPGA